MTRLFSLLVFVCFSTVTALANAYYNPQLGRWMTRDPLEERAGPNMTAMVQNNAVNLVDPFGLEVRSPKCLDDTFKANNVTAGNGSRSGDFYVYSGSSYWRAGGPSASYEDLASEILGRMIESPRVFNVRDSASLMTHVNARIRVVRETAQKGFGFGAGDQERRNSELWECVPQSGGTGCIWRTKPGVDATEAARDLRQSPAKYNVSCQTATLLTFCSALGGGSDLRSILVLMDTQDPADWIPGEQGWIRNRGHVAKAGLEGENLIYTGGDLWWGHLRRANTYQPLSAWWREVQSFPGAVAELSSERTLPRQGLSF